MFEKDVGLEENGELKIEVIRDHLPAVSGAESVQLALGALLSAILFQAGRPLTVKQLAKASETSEDEVEMTLENLGSLYQDQTHGFSLQFVNGGYQLRTSCGAAEAIKRLSPVRVKRLSRASAETLAVIAYRQPVQRAEIEAIRGVDALPTLKTLLDAKLIRIVGHEQSAGQPALFGTTNLFLERFGLADLSDLPSAKELEQLSGEPGEIEDQGEEGDLLGESVDREGEIATAAEIVLAAEVASDEI